MIKYVIFKDKQEEQKQTTDVVYRLNCVENKMEELFEVTGFEESDETCKAIFEEIRDNYDFHANEIYPVIRFEDDTEFVGVIGILVPIVANGKVYGMNMDCEPETLEIAGTICKELYDVDENDDDYDAKWEMLKDAIQQYHLFDEVCEFVADKIIERSSLDNAKEDKDIVKVYFDKDDILDRANRMEFYHICKPEKFIDFHKNSDGSVVAHMTKKDSVDMLSDFNF